MSWHSKNGVIHVIATTPEEVSADDYEARVEHLAWVDGGERDLEGAWTVQVDRSAMMVAV